MTIQDLYAAVQATGMTGRQAKEVVDKIVETAGNALLRGEVVKIKGLLSMHPYQPASRRIHNFATGQVEERQPNIKVRTILSKKLRNAASKETSV